MAQAGRNHELDGIDVLPFGAGLAPRCRSGR